MNDITATVDRYIAIWNEGDAERRRVLIAQTWTDDAGYVDPELKASPLGRDCLKAAEEYLRQQNWASEKTLAIWRSDALLKIEEAVSTVQREAGPDPYKENWCALASKHLSEGVLSDQCP